MRTLIFTALLLISPLVNAQPHRPDLTPDQVEQLRNRQQYNSADRRPRWCRHYDYMDYRRELRACGDDRRCRWDVRRKADNCGLR